MVLRGLPLLFAWGEGGVTSRGGGRIQGEYGGWGELREGEWGTRGGGGGNSEDGREVGGATAEEGDNGSGRRRGRWRGWRGDVCRGRWRGRSGRWWGGVVVEGRRASEEGGRTVGEGECDRVSGEAEVRRQERGYRGG
ncbi:hypothetical protein Tco_0772056 [Tanacetum coccineum]|uniref:Uncharacterized protein n=1 Tax=Tanacetum coccineum TaxID=301880 RepID=A0ABQ4ZHR9_9ASTR